MPKTPRNIFQTVFGWYLGRNDSLLSIDALILVVVVSIALFFAFNAEQQVDAERISCKSFLSRADAQKAFNADPVKYRSLDRNHNNIVCESSR